MRVIAKVTDRHKVPHRHRARAMRLSLSPLNSGYGAGEPAKAGVGLAQLVGVLIPTAPPHLNSEL